VIYDEEIHASVHEGMKVSRSSLHLPFSHNDVSSLRQVLKALKTQETKDRKQGRNVFVAVEGIYSMDGDICPLEEVVEVVEEELGKRGYIVVDEAHSTGVLGEKGRGLVNELGLEGRVFARLVTFGKALGANGGKCSFLFCFFFLLDFV